MRAAPLILITPSVQRRGVEMADNSISLSNRYAGAVAAAGGLPLILPCETSAEFIAEAVRRADGVMLTGGEDLQPELFTKKLPKKLAATVRALEPERDLLELQLIDELFRQRKPLLAICRGHQVLNVALGGTLIVDIAQQVPNALNHRQMDRRYDPVHEVRLTPGTGFAMLMGEPTLGVNSTHHQALGRLAKPLRATAFSPDGIVEAAELRDARQLPFLQSVQFHPERLWERYPVFQKLFRGFVRACARRGAF
ncbi:MAG: gamma-glutamyl-gamma-aminobutyrate hydrolase family protein [Verrucomicrobia bacterium]|nr:gamma-glutamyl-gamma-aminobutyrate hydrolase family protein [Verrucomicrobiota bacterium]